MLCLSNLLLHVSNTHTHTDYYENSFSDSHSLHVSVDRIISRETDDCEMSQSFEEQSIPTQVHKT